MARSAWSYFTYVHTSKKYRTAIYSHTFLNIENAARSNELHVNILPENGAFDIPSEILSVDFRLPCLAAAFSCNLYRTSLILGLSLGLTCNMESEKAMGTLKSTCYIANFMKFCWAVLELQWQADTWLF